MPSLLGEQPHSEYGDNEEKHEIDAAQHTVVFRASGKQDVQGKEESGNQEEKSGEYVPDG